MRNWKNWLFPLLTCLTVAALALLPLRLSTLRDGQLTGEVHAEPLSGDSNFPFKPPELPGRIWLLVQWQEFPETLTVMAQELEGGDRDRELQRLRQALAELEPLLPPETAELLSWLDDGDWSLERYYLRDQTDLSSASFTRAAFTDKYGRLYFLAVLDGESGQILSLELGSVKGLTSAFDTRELGEALLDRLGLAWEPLENSEDWCTSFRLPACKSTFLTAWNEFDLGFGFRMDWSAIDSSMAEAYGRDASVNDAGPIQIR